MADRCKRRLTVDNYPSAAAGVTVKLDPDDVEVTIRAVDGADAPVAWELRVAPGSAAFNFDAGEAYTDQRMVLDETVDLIVLSAAGGQVQVIRWST
jgi:hypothetical protein